MRRFDFHQPRSFDDAIALLGSLGGRTSLLAGGTDLLVEIKEELRTVDHLVDIKKIEGMRDLTFDEKAGLRFGALVTVREIELNPVVRKHYPNLAKAASLVGSIQVRNRGTIVGNLCRASPSADNIPPLIADNASLEILGAAGRKKIALTDFFTGPGKTKLAPDEIVTAVEIPAPLPGTGKAYIKHGRRKAMELATVGVAATLRMQEGRCADISIALGAVAPTVIRARRTEELLRGKEITDALLAQAGETAMSEVSPISNVRASANYRRDMIGVLTRRAITQAMEQIP